MKGFVVHYYIYPEMLYVLGHNGVFIFDTKPHLDERSTAMYPTFSCSLYR